MNGNSQNSNEDFNAPQWRLGLSFAALLLVMFFWGLFFPAQHTGHHNISYTLFLTQLDSHNIKSVSIRNLHVTGEFFDEVPIQPPDLREPISVLHFQTWLPSFQDGELLARLEEEEVYVTVESPEELTPFWRLLLGMLPWIFLIGIWVLILRRSQMVQGGAGGLFSFGASKARRFDPEKTKVTFDDVAGMQQAKLDLGELIDFLRNPERFHTIGASVPKGVLLIGPPGTGKTLLARATAGEAKVPFFSISASEFIEMFVGVGASRVRDMFKKAREAHPSIIFVDEIDAVGRTRGAGFGGGHDEREQTLNQLLSEMDGFAPHEEVIVMAATNRPDVLDPALLRPGRFDRQIMVDRPGWKDRLRILKVHVRNKILTDDVDLETVARGTPGMTGADLENLANEAALVALRKNKKEISREDFEDARDKILMGAVREETISSLERKITAYHEAGHALVALQLPGTDPIHKVSIVPRGMAMGVTQLLPEEDRHYYPKTYLMNKLSVALAGRVAEKIVFDELSSGAQNDLKEATSLAEKMVAQWGMSDKVGPINLGRGEEHPFLGRELSLPKRYSEDMGWLMDQEIRQLVLDAEASAREVLAANREGLEALAEALLEEEVLDRKEVERIVQKAGMNISVTQG